MKANHGQEALRIDRPVAGLLRDLRRRGLLDDTLVLFTTEFGRTPFTQSAADVVGLGRDHNQYGFSVWLAGAGLKHGMAYGSTDEIGWKADENPVTWPDFHATVLHLLGIDHETLNLLPQRNPSPADECARRGHQADPGLSGDGRVAHAPTGSSRAGSTLTGLLFRIFRPILTLSTSVFWDRHV